MSGGKKGVPRDHLLWQAHDLFGLHHSVCCPTCGQTVRDAAGERRSSKLRMLVQQIHAETVPLEFSTSAAVDQGAAYIKELGELAQHVFGERGGEFITKRMIRFLERQQSEHPQESSQPVR